MKLPSFQQFGETSSQDGLNSFASIVHLITNLVSDLLSIGDPSDCRPGGAAAGSNVIPSSTSDGLKEQIEHPLVSLPRISPIFANSFLAAICLAYGYAEMGNSPT
ncbi:unnamed protein product [Protopolystoma xenopodis]|uniref:Uncharacterized protein n=1 Tax=Protopolystoma xenopodis TaxID=117903 RepID=A0A3S5BF21_9PLAT|nr:unnamed protein product [Protopolystoma xenopodis]